MKRDTDRLLRTVEVLGSNIAMNANGAISLVLNTKQLGSVAFVLDQQKIDHLRKELATAETYLRRVQAFSSKH